MILFRAVSLAEYEDLVKMGQFRPGQGTMEGKWFADTYAGVLDHACDHYPDGNCQIVEADVPDDILAACYRLPNLDGHGPATYLEEDDLTGIVPIFRD